MTTKTTDTKKTQTFHAWLDAEQITLPAFASATKLGLSTAAALRSKSKHGIRTVLHRATARSIRAAYPTCPILDTAVIL